jgi:hypothetical protein
MRLSSLGVAFVFFLLPSAVCAQHSVSPPPPVAIPVAAHVPPTPPASIHTFGSSPAPNSGAISRASAQGLRPVSNADRELNAPRANGKNLSKSRPNSQPKEPESFSAIHRRPDKCKNDSCAQTPPATSLTRKFHAAAPGAFETRLECRVIPVTNLGIPCNVYAPCCP